MSRTIPQAYAGKYSDLYAVLLGKKYAPDPGFPAELDKLGALKGLPAFSLSDQVELYAVWRYRKQIINDKGIIQDLEFLAGRLPVRKGSSDYASMLVKRCRMMRDWFEEQERLKRKPADFMADLVRRCKPSLLEKCLIEGRWDGLFQVWCRRRDLFTGAGAPLDEKVWLQNTTWAASILNSLSPVQLPGPFLGTSALTDQEFGWLLHLFQGNPLATAPDLPFQLSSKTMRVFATYPAGIFHLGVSDLLLLADLTAKGAQPGYALRIVRMLAHELGNTDRVAIARHLVAINYPADDLLRLGDMLRGNVGKQQSDAIHGKQASEIKNLVDAWLVTVWHDHGRIKGKQPRHETKEFKKKVGHDHYHIKPLFRGRDLFTEGVVLRQAIFAHLQEVLERRLLVYSLRILKKNDAVQRLCTIELRGADTMENRFRLRNKENKLPHELRIVQVRGTDDRAPTEQEVNIIREWAWRNKLEWTPPAPRTRPTP
jgi:hypothetical protein